jgi:hypothetical protein
VKAEQRMQKPPRRKNLGVAKNRALPTAKRHWCIEIRWRFFGNFFFDPKNKRVALSLLYLAAYSFAPSFLIHNYKDKDLLF